VSATTAVDAAWNTPPSTTATVISAPTNQIGDAGSAIPANNVARIRSQVTMTRRRG
jgi:hypothetical protein